MRLGIARNADLSFRSTSTQTDYEIGRHSSALSRPKYNWPDVCTLSRYRTLRRVSFTVSVTSESPRHEAVHTSSSPVVFGTTLVALLALILTSIIIVGHSYLNQPPAWTLVKYPVGILDANEPSGEAPPLNGSMGGFTESYINDFNINIIPPDWNVFTGVPSGDPGAQFGRAHTVISQGMLDLNTWRDPRYDNKWVTGGICQCGRSQLYGAYLVRSRITGSGPNEVELLWPTTNKWPPEIDFNETGGGMQLTSATVHFGANDSIQQSHLRINLSQWHTWGVIWNKSTITYTVDGRAWGRTTNPSESPHVPMTLDLEQRTSCSVHAQCPKAPVSMQVDWVVDYGSVVPRTNE